MLILNNLCLRFGEQIIFDDLCATIAYDEKIGLLGRNGTGKSTLLKAIAGDQYLDGGTISFDKKKKIGYLPQEVVLQSEKVVFDETFSIFDEFLSLKKEQHAIEACLEKELPAEEASKLTERYLVITEKIAAFDSSAAQEETERMLTGLGFSKESMHQSVNTLSVGWQMRIVLAKLLLQKADFYLFDEPTNHLDLSTKEWFLQFLKEAPFGYLLVTHDRYFLDNACKKIIELERGHAKRYNGNFSLYVRQKEEEQERLRAAKIQQDKEIARKQATIDRFRYKSSKASMAQSMIKQLEKIELIEIDPPLPTVKFSFAPVKRTGDVVLDIKDVQQSFGNKKLFNHASTRVMREQKVALIAPNGTGKTTLFNLIVGKLPLQHGSITYGHNVETAYFEQEQARILKPENTVLKEVLDACPKVPEAKIRSFLGAFLFSGDDVEKKIKHLSGGERNRVAMVKILLQDANFLLLDEPTNHLDIYAKEVLLQALQQYKGTIMMVSHDHDFIQKVANTIIELTSDGLFTYDGDYESFLYHKKMLNHAPEEVVLQGTKKPAKSEKVVLQEKRALLKQLNTLESAIKKLEQKRDEDALKLHEITYGCEQFHTLSRNIQETQKKIDAALHEWDTLVDTLD